MEVFCPRCDNSVPEITSKLIDSGICPTCSGQVYLGRFEGVSQVEGFVAVLFEPGCNVGVPLDLYGELGFLGDDEQTLPNMSVVAVARIEPAAIHSVPMAFKIRCPYRCPSAPLFRIIGM